MLYKNVLIRVDLNTIYPHDIKFQIIKETVNFYLRISQCVILITHYKDGSESIKFLCHILESLFHEKITFLDRIKRPEDHQNFCLLENIRSFKGELESDDIFAKELASIGDFFVHEAFSTSHRNHTSIKKLSQHLPHTLGFSYEKEVHMLNLILSKIQKPILIIIGGTKFESKRDILLKLQQQCDYLFLGDAIIQSKNQDISPERIKQLQDLIAKSNTIIWNGSLGKTEQPPFDAGTHIISNHLQSIAKEKTIIIGGGDLVYFLKPDYATYTTTAGGALLKFISNALK